MLIAADLSKGRKIYEVQMPSHQLRERLLRAVLGKPAEQFSISNHCVYPLSPRRQKNRTKIARYLKTDNVPKGTLSATTPQRAPMLGRAFIPTRRAFLKQEVSAAVA
jgi:hypothetical protein